MMDTENTFMLASHHMSGETILLVDDDIELTGLMSQYLQQNGFTTLVENHGSMAVEKIANNNPDLIVLDIMLPGSDGLSICKAIRDDFKGPIIMLTALDDEIDEVTGLEIGADDYLAKPIKPRVLLAHVRAQLRRYQRDDNNTAQLSSIVRSGELVIDAGKREVNKAGESIELTSAEFDLLWILAENVGQAVSREFLYEKIYRLDFDGVDRSIDLRVSRLRKKIGLNDAASPYIKTVRSIGYQLSD